MIASAGFCYCFLVLYNRPHSSVFRSVVLSFTLAAWSASIVFLDFYLASGSSCSNIFCPPPVVRLSSWLCEWKMEMNRMREEPLGASNQLTRHPPTDDRFPSTATDMIANLTKIPTLEKFYLNRIQLEFNKSYIFLIFAEE